MELVNMHEAKTHLSRLVERAAAGEQIVIGRAGRPVARLVAYEETRSTPRPYGLAKGRIWIAGDIDEADAEIAAMFDAGTRRPVDE